MAEEKKPVQEPEQEANTEPAEESAKAAEKRRKRKKKSEKIRKRITTACRRSSTVTSSSTCACLPSTITSASVPQTKKNAVYNNAVSDTINAILPVADNIDRALAQENVSAEDMKKGVEMIAKPI